MSLFVSFVLSHFVCLALYERELEEEEEEEVGSEDEPEVLRLPDLLFRRPPQLLHYTAALSRPYDDDTYTYDPEHPPNFEQREELTIISKISKRNPECSHQLWHKHTEIRTCEYVNLSVSVCEEGSFGDDCGVSCEDCANGGVCASERDRCVCAPGWTGVTCNDSEFLYSLLSLTSDLNRSLEEI